MISPGLLRTYVIQRKKGKVLGKRLDHCTAFRVNNNIDIAYNYVGVYCHLISCVNDIHVM